MARNRRALRRLAPKARSARQRPAYFRMLAGLFALYTIIIGFGDEGGAAPTRILLLGFLLWNAMRLRAAPGWRWWTIGLTAMALAVTIWADVVASPKVAGGVIGGA